MGKRKTGRKGKMVERKEGQENVHVDVTKRTSLAPHERLPEILVVPREKTPTGAAARGKP